MARKSLYMEHTKISANRTAAQMSELLGQYGARAVMTEYDDDNKIAALSFTIRVEEKDVPFRLPVRVEPVYEYLQSKHSYPYSYKESDREKAQRIAWRQIFHWMQAQFALIKTGMVRTEEVFLPYVHVGINETLYERIAAGNFQKALNP